MYYLFFSDHYIVRVSWINSTAVSAIWMNRSQNLSVVVHCLQQNNWICYEVNFSNIHTSNTYCCRQEIVYILFLLLPFCPTIYFNDLINHFFTTILLSSIDVYIKISLQFSFMRYVIWIIWTKTLWKVAIHTKYSSMVNNICDL